MNPWEAQFPTLTGSGSYTIRSKHFIRSLDGLEALSIAGWDPTLFSEGYFPTSRLAGQIAGNAFSAFAIGPILMRGRCRRRRGLRGRGRHRLGEQRPRHERHGGRRGELGQRRG